MRFSAVILVLLGVVYFSAGWSKTAVKAPVKRLAKMANGESQSSEKFSFQGLKLKGQLKKPDLSYIYKRKGIRAEKIVNIPDNFNSEIAHDSRKL